MSRYGFQTRRRVRILNALQGRRLEEVFLNDPDFRDDLAREAAEGAKQLDDSLLLPEHFQYIKEQTELIRVARWRQLYTGEPTVTTSPVLPSAPISSADQARAKGTVVIVPGGLASALRDLATASPSLIWLFPPALLAGRFYDLQLAPYAGPNAEFELDHGVRVEAFRAVQMYYDLLFSALSADGWEPLIFPYDWRKDMDHPDVVGRLQSLIRELGCPERPVHIVTHSQGGTVARKALTNLAHEIGIDYARQIVGQVILLGPANYGVFVAALAIAGSFRQIPVVRLFPRPPARVQKVTASFTALYQLMPWNEHLVPSLGTFDIRKPSFWDEFGNGAVELARLARSFPTNNAQPWGEGINTERFKDQITVILGSHPFRKTPGGVRFRFGRLVVDHEFDLDGDGWVPDKLAILETSKAYRAHETGHVQLPMAPRVIHAVRSILDGSEPDLPRVNEHTTLAT